MKIQNFSPENPWWCAQRLGIAETLGKVLCSMELPAIEGPTIGYGSASTPLNSLIGSTGTASLKWEFWVAANDERFGLNHVIFIAPRTPENWIETPDKNRREIFERHCKMLIDEVSRWQ